MSLCPCGSGRPYEECCETYIEGRETAPTVPAPSAEAFPGNNETPAHSSADAQTRINRARIMTRPLKNGKHGLSKKLYARCGASSSTEVLPPQGFIIQASKEKHSP